MKNIFFIGGAIILFLLLLFFNVFIFTIRTKNKNDNNIYTDKINIIEKNDKKIIENINYDFDLILNKDFYVSGYDKFIKISNENISKNLNKNQCVLNFSTEKIDKEICDYIKDECMELGCKKYVCEKYKNDWYKTIEDGDFYGTGDIIFAKTDNDYTYFLNLECENREDDNENNVLIKEVIDGFRKR